MVSVVVSVVVNDRACLLLGFEQKRTPPLATVPSLIAPPLSAALGHDLPGASTGSGGGGFLVGSFGSVRSTGSGGGGGGVAGMLSSMAVGLAGSASGAKPGTPAGGAGGGMRQGLEEDSSDDEEVDGYDDGNGAAAIRWVAFGVGAWCALLVFLA